MNSNSSESSRQATLKFQMYASRVSDVARAGIDRLTCDGRGKLTTSKEEQKIMANWRFMTYGWAGVSGALTLIAARSPPFAFSTLFSAVLGATVGTTLGLARGIREAPETLAALIENRKPSDMVDVVICPALREWQGCIDDESCKLNLQNAAAVFKDKDCVIDLVYRCKARSNATSHQESYSSSQSGAEIAIDGDFDNAEEQLSHFDFPPPPSNDAEDD